MTFTFASTLWRTLVVDYGSEHKSSEYECKFVSLKYLWMILSKKSAIMFDWCSLSFLDRVEVNIDTSDCWWRWRQHTIKPARGFNMVHRIGERRLQHILICSVPMGWYINPARDVIQHLDTSGLYTVWYTSSYLLRVTRPDPARI
jgi:hypothetical protein